MKIADPRKEFTKNLIELCGNDGSVVVYNQSFEKSRNDELAKIFPEYAENLKAINQRVIDLLDVFRGKFIYSPKQNSSSSIKAVLPAFTKHNYSEMEIANGGEAMNIYLNFIKGKIANETKMIKDLLSYCKLDTYAMVELVKMIQRVSS
jgi:hypothetical protein